MPERSRRLYAGVEALKLSYDGISYISRLFDCSRNIVMEGINEFSEEKVLSAHQSRRQGGGRTPLLNTHSDIEAAFVPTLK